MAVHEAVRLPVFNGPAGWSVILPPAAPRARLEGATGCDVAIIGAGFAGLSAARRLKQIDRASGQSKWAVKPAENRRKFLPRTALLPRAQPHP